jgi:hypothetical protein
MEAEAPSHRKLTQKVSDDAIIHRLRLNDIATVIVCFIRQSRVVRYPVPADPPIAHNPVTRPTGSRGIAKSSSKVLVQPLTESRPSVCNPPPIPHHTYPSYAFPSTHHPSSPSQPHAHPIHPATHPQLFPNQGISNHQSRHHQKLQGMCSSCSPSPSFYATSSSTSISIYRANGHDHKILSAKDLLVHLSIEASGRETGSARCLSIARSAR